MRMSSAPGHLRRRWRRWRGLSGRQRRLTLQAWLLLPLAAAALRLVPLRHLLALLALRPGGSSGAGPTTHDAVAPAAAGTVAAGAAPPGNADPRSATGLHVDPLSRDIAAAISRAGGRAIAGRTCLARAVVGTVLLHRHGRPAALTLGVATPRTLTAHAWLQSDGAPISGFPVSSDWQPLVRFEG